MYEPTEEGKEFDRRMKLDKIASKNKGRDCEDYEDGKDGINECVVTERCNWKEQGYTPIFSNPYNLSSIETCCYGIKIKEEELDKK